MSVYDEIRDKLPLSQVVSKYTKLIPVDPSAGKYKARCPLHSEKTPSFYINEGLGVFYCFGCKSGGTVIDFIHEHDGIPIREIPAYVQEAYGIKLDNAPNSSVSSKKGKQLQVLKLFVEFFNTEENRATALNYLKNRIPKATEDLLDAYSIFYAPRGKSAQIFVESLPDDLVNAAIDLRLLYRTRNGGLFLPFTNRVIFPIRTYGPVVALNGRALDHNEQKKYLLTNFKKKQYVWGLKEAISLAKKEGLSYVYAVEGVIDALALAAHKKPAIAYLGQSISKDQMRIIQASFSHLVLVPDGDRAGRQGAHNSIKNAIFSQFPISGEVVKLPKGEDVASFLQKKSVEDLNKLPTRTFEDYYIDFFVLAAKKNVPTKTADAIRSAFLATILPNLLDYETNPMSSSILMRIAERLAVNPQYLQLRINEGIVEARHNIRKKLRKSPNVKSMELKVTPGELRLLGALRVSPILLEKLVKKPWYMVLSIYFRDIAESFYEQYMKGTNFISILEKRIDKADEAVKEEYYRILSLIPTVKNEQSAEEIFKEYVNLFDIRFSKNTQVKKLLALAQAVSEMTSPISDKERQKLNKKARKIQKEKATKEKLDVPSFDNVI